MAAGEQRKASRRAVMIAALMFVLGFTTVFVALGASASLVGALVRSWSAELSIVAGIIIIIMGLHFLGVFRIALLYRDARIEVNRKPAGLVGAYVLGLAFAFGWTPCVGPVLAAILFVAGSQGEAMRGAGLLAVYSLGIGLPFILAAAFATRFLAFAARFRRHMHKVEMAMGGFLVLTGILFITGQMAAISYWLLEAFPGFANIG